MGYKKGPKQSIGICESTRRALERIKDREQKRLGLRTYSWDSFLNGVATGHVVIGGAK